MSQENVDARSSVIVGGEGAGTDEFGYLIPITIESGPTRCST